MSSRIQVILNDEDREAFRRQARREGLSLSAWLREAGRRRLIELSEPPINDLASLHTFFAGLPDRDAAETEPEWSEHLRVIAESRRRDVPST